MHVLSSGPPSALPWAINLRFASGANLVIGLGDLLDGQPTYMPDTLLVIGSREAAVSVSFSVNGNLEMTVAAGWFARWRQAIDR